MTNSDIILRLLDYWKGFPNIGTDGYYEYSTQTIHLNSVEKKHILGSFSDFNFSGNRKIYSLLFHELTHWLDHTSTIWGQSNLISVYNAINSRENNDPHEFWRIQKTHIDTSKIHFPKYFSTITANSYSWDNNPWKWMLTCGQQFDFYGKLNKKEPIVFTRFQDSAGNDIARVPFSMASLLEISAINTELMLEMFFINKLDNLREKIVENELFKKRYFNDIIYNPEFCEYTVAAHCVSNHSGLIDVLTSYQLGAAISKLCLNLPSSEFLKIKPAGKFQINAGWAEATDALIKNQDRGFLFLLISSNLNELNSYKGIDIKKSIDYALDKTGLPSSDKIMELAQLSLLELELDIVPGVEEENLRKLLTIGRNNFNKIKDIEKNHIIDSFSNLNSVEFPGVLLGDGECVDTKNTTDHLKLDVDKWSRYDDYTKKIKQFSEACIG